MHSLIAAIVAGGANGITVMIVSPTEFNLHAGIGKLGQVIFVSSLIGLAAFLKQSPLPPEDPNDPPTK
jgi:hypothetical protein